MKHEVQKYFIDIKQSIEIIEQYVDNIGSFTVFANDLKTIDAVERRLGIIGEALWKAQKLDASVEVSDIKKIIGLRHILVHDYDLIDAAIIWTILQQNLPVLKEEISILLSL
ncbi:HepT-like ribonuclease domain-containing protein [Chitinophagaceae bacterium MMS25-I14]